MNKIKYSILALLCLLVLQPEVTFGQNDGCPQNITLNQSHPTSMVVKSQNSISSGILVNENLDVEYKASGLITLTDKFHAKPNSNFRAVAEDVTCENVAFSGSPSDCIVVDREIENPSAGTYNLHFDTPMGHDDGVPYVIHNIDKNKSETIVIDWADFAVVEVENAPPENESNNYIVYIDVNGCTPPSSVVNIVTFQGASSPIELSCPNTLIGEFEFGVRNDGEDWQKIKSEIDVVPQREYKLIFNAKLTGAGSAFIEWRANPAIGTVTNWFRKSIEIDSNGDFDVYELDIPKVANFNLADLFANKEVGSSVLEIENVCLIDLEGGDTPPTDQTTAYQYLKFIITNADNYKLLELDWLDGATEYPQNNLTSNLGGSAEAAGDFTHNYKAFDGVATDAEGLWVGDVVPKQVILDLKNTSISPSGIRIQKKSWQSLLGFRCEGSNDLTNWDLLFETNTSAGDWLDKEFDFPISENPNPEENDPQPVESFTSPCWLTVNEPTKEDNNTVNLGQAKAIVSSGTYDITVEDEGLEFTGIAFDPDGNVQRLGIPSSYANNPNNSSKTCTCIFERINSNDPDVNDPQPANLEGCEPTNADSDDCNPHDWLVNFEAGKDDFSNSFQPDNSKSGAFKVGMNLSRIESYGTMIAHKNLFKLMRKWSPVPFINNGSEIATKFTDKSAGCNDNLLMIQELIKHSKLEGADIEITPFKDLVVRTVRDDGSTFEGGITFDNNGYPDNELPKKLQIFNTKTQKVLVPATKVGISTVGLLFTSYDGDVSYTKTEHTGTPQETTETKTDEMWTMVNSGLNVKGEYVIFFDGNGDVTVNGDIKNSGETFILSANRAIEVLIKRSSSTPNHLQNFRIYKISDHESPGPDCANLLNTVHASPQAMATCKEKYTLNRTINLPKSAGLRIIPNGTDSNNNPKYRIGEISNGQPAPGGDDFANTKSKYYEEFIKRLSEFPIIRFMNMYRINHSTNKLASDIPPLGYYSYSTNVNRWAPDCNDDNSCSKKLNLPLFDPSQEPHIKNDPNNMKCYRRFPLLNEKAVPLEEIKNIYEAVKQDYGKKIDIWFNIPHNVNTSAVNDNYVKHVGSSFNNWFKNEDINIYLEYSNEVWNNFEQGEDIREMEINSCKGDIGSCPDLNGSTDPLGPTGQTEYVKNICIDNALINYAEKSKEIFQIFESELQSANNNVELKRVIASQHGNPTVTAKIVRFLESSVLQPGDFDVLSVGGYFYPKLDDQETRAILPSSNALCNDFNDDDCYRFNQVTHQQLKNATEKSIENVWEPMMLNTKRIADCYNVELMLYEGGQHILNQLLIDKTNKKSYKVEPEAMNAFQDSPEMKELYEDWFNFLKFEAKIDGILGYSLASRSDAKDGSWGHLRNIFEDPCIPKVEYKFNKYKALMNPTYGNSMNCTAQKQSSESSLSTNFKVYPNPFSNNLTLITEKENGTMRIVDMTGRILLQQNIDGLSITVDTKTLKPGYYLVEVQQGDTIQTQKIIKH